VSESPLRKLLVQASHYGLASVGTMIAGLISFPLLTRLFSVEDYGAMSLIAATITIAVAVGKVGVQHSILRYQSEISAGKSKFTLAQLVSTTFFGMVGSALVVTAGLIIATQLVPVRWLGDPRLRYLFPIASLVIIVQVIESALLNFLRAEQRTALFMSYQVAKKYVVLGFIVVTVLLIARTLKGFYTANVLAESLSVVTLLVVLFARPGRTRPSTAQFSRPLYWELLAFGIPMMVGYEMSGIVLSVGDRYVIDGTIGQAPLGLYAAAYNLCQYVQAVFIASVGQAIMPLYMQMWDEKGLAETSAFISRSLGRYLMFGAPVVAGLAAVGPELLPSLASDKYASAAAILPWVIAGMVVDGTNSMVGAGLFIHRKTRTIMTVVMSGAILNIILNLILVPRIGIMGAAIATLISYAFTAFLLAVTGRRLLPVHVPWGSVLRACAAAALMYGAIIFILPGHKLITVAVRGVVGAVVYALVMLLIDNDARELVGKGLSRFRKST
jgi:O-antigen/teichoic acid export membrane protein